MKFLKKMLIYFVGTVFNKLIVFILVPFYTSRFTPADYGNGDLALTTALMLIGVAFMDLWTPLLRFSYDSSRQEDKNRVVTNIALLLVICIPAYLVLSVGMSLWQNLSFAGWMTGYGFSMVVLQVFQYASRADGNSRLFVLSGVVSSALQLVLCLVLVSAFHMGAESMLIAPTVANMAAAVYVERKGRYLSRIDRNLVSFRLIRDLVRFAFPLAINEAAYWGMTNINRYFARNHLGAEANGYIALGAKFAALVGIAITIFTRAWQESAFERNADENRSQYYSQMLHVYVGFMSWGTAMLILATNLLFPYLINSAYAPTQLILPIYYLSALGHAVSNFFGQIFGAEKKTQTVFVATLAGAAVNIGLLYFTITQWGLYAVPVALTAGYLANDLIRLIAVQRMEIRLSIHYAQMCLDAALIAAACAAVYFAFSIWVKISLALCISLAAAYMYRKELQSLVSSLKKARA